MRLPDPAPVIDASDPAKAALFAAALQNPRYHEVARAVEQSYRHWDKVKFIARAEKLDPEILWLICKSSRRSHYRFLPLKGADGVSLRFTLPDLLQQELMLVDQQLAGRLAAASDEQPLTEDERERFILSALREEAIASSMLEGAATTRREAKDMLASGRKPRTHGERMVANNYKAISFIREHRHTPLTSEFILEVQRMLTQETLPPDQCGRFRTDVDRVLVVDQYGEVVHTPPPAIELTGRLEQLCAFANQRASEVPFIHPVVRASVIHFMIGFDHPFCDGNGRTARALFYWSMLRAGYWLFEYLPISRMIYAGPSKYTLAYQYTETDEFDVTYFLVYKARIIALAREELGEYIRRKQQEMAAARQIVETDPRLNHRQREVVARLVRNPALRLTIQDHKGRENIAYDTARADLLDLEEWGYLTRVAARGKQFQFQRGPGLADRAN
jgi:Fic family protein